MRELIRQHISHWIISRCLTSYYSIVINHRVTTIVNIKAVITNRLAYIIEIVVTVRVIAIVMILYMSFNIKEFKELI